MLFFTEPREVWHGMLVAFFTDCFDKRGNVWNVLNTPEVFFDSGLTLAKQIPTRKLRLAELFCLNLCLSDVCFCANDQRFFSCF